MYSVRDYASMINDTRRVEAYQRAIQLTVTPDSVVLDIGTGLGIMAFLACQAGVRKVYAIEPSEVINVARQLSRLNGYEDRIVFIQDLSSNVTLPEQADVMVSDIGGVLPPFQQHLPAIADARKRLLKSQGELIPRQDTLWAAVVNAPIDHAKIAPPIARSLGLDMQLAWEMAANCYANARLSEADLASDPHALAVLDYATIDDPNLHSEIQLTLRRSGTGHGICLWFERTLTDGVCYSTAPGQHMIYGSLFLPWPTPVELDSKDAVLLDIRADLAGPDYVWTWNSSIFNGNNIKCKYRQSTFLSEPRSLDRLHRQAATHVPKLTEEGESERFMLQLMDGSNAIEDIARQVQQKFPARFPTLNKAIGHVGELSRKYSV